MDGLTQQQGLRTRPGPIDLTDPALDFVNGRELPLPNPPKNPTKIPQNGNGERGSGGHLQAGRPGCGGGSCSLRCAGDHSDCVRGGGGQEGRRWVQERSRGGPDGGEKGGASEEESSLNTAGPGGSGTLRGVAKLPPKGIARPLWTCPLPTAAQPQPEMVLGRTDVSLRFRPHDLSQLRTC